MAGLLFLIGGKDDSAPLLSYQDSHRRVPQVAGDRPRLLWQSPLAAVYNT
ncbi:hypothetical protein [uncultured Thermosynechococcus sp.]|nr:hypothetical protein [uncultured Thermosynechococcus sp.]